MPPRIRDRCEEVVGCPTILEIVPPYRSLALDTLGTGVFQQAPNALLRPWPPFNRYPKTFRLLMHLRAAPKGLEADNLAHHNDELDRKIRQHNPS